MFRVLLVPLLLLIATGRATADPLDDLINAEMAKNNIPGLSVAVLHRGDDPIFRGYGKANLELNVPATSDTVYELGSVTKQFTAVAIMMLVEQEKLHVDDKLAAVLEGMPKTWDGVTIRHLLTHTSGIKNTTEQREFGKLIRQESTREQVLAVVRDKPLDFPPGEKWAYSNTNYQLLGMVIEKVAGEPYAKFVEEKIFKPLAMNATRMNDRGAIIPNRAQGYSRRPGGLRVAEYTSPSVPFAAGAMVSTVTDLAKWDRALSGEQLLKRATLQQMWTPGKLNDGSVTRYGFGWEVTSRNGQKIVRHGGAIQGFSSFVMRTEDGTLAVMLLANCDQQQLAEISRQIVGRYPVIVLPKTRPAG